MTKTRKVKKTCSASWHEYEGPAVDGPFYCTKDARARGLCWGHYQQQRRGQPYGPLEHTDTQVVLPTPRVSPHCATVLQDLAQRRGISVYALVQEALEAYVRNHEMAKDALK